MNYTLLRSKRKTLSLEITETGEILIRAPKRVSKKFIEDFISQKQSWISSKQQNVTKQQDKLKELGFELKDLPKLKHKARKTLKQATEQYSKELNFPYKRFRLSSAKKRWGSCSSAKTISINWKLILTPKEIQDYVILHELVHLKHMNHSRQYWQELARVCPDFKAKKRYLREHSFLLLLP